MKLRRSHRRSLRRAGITLIECLVYISTLAVITTLAFGAFYQVWDHSRALRRGADDLVRALRAGEQWRADVRAATGPLQLLPEEGGQTLKIPQASNEVHYVWLKGQLWRIADPERIGQALMTNVAQCRWLEDPRRRVTAWRWELELQTRQKTAQMTPLFSFTAVPRPGNKP